MFSLKVFQKLFIIILLLILVHRVSGQQSGIVTQGRADVISHTLGGTGIRGTQYLIITSYVFFLRHSVLSLCDTLGRCMSL